VGLGSFTLPWQELGVDVLLRLLTRCTSEQRRNSCHAASSVHKPTLMSSVFSVPSVLKTLWLSL
jgi:hypothetical protein